MRVISIELHEVTGGEVEHQSVLEQEEKSGLSRRLQHKVIVVLLQIN